MRRLAALLLALVAAVGVAVAAPQPAAADGVVGNVTEGACYAMGGPLGLLANGVSKVTSGDTLCDKIGDAAEEKVEEAWQNVKDSVLGDVIESAADAVRWVIKKVLTVALLGPSLDLKATGLWSGDATLAGMLVWLGLVIATFGAMWQLGRMAVTGQAKYAGQAMMGWVQNVFLSAAGVGMVAVLLSAGDAMTTGLVEATFDNDGEAYERIVAVMVPKGVSNPVTMLCIVAVLLLVGFIQLILVFLRQSLIPLQCLLLPIAGAGRVGGETTQKWAPRLITSICVAIAYKPLLAIIICMGFAQFGHASTLAEWLRGCATLVLGILAPGPLMKIFAPFGEAVGAGMSASGAMGGLGSAAGYLAGKAGDGGDGGQGGQAAGSTPVAHAQLVQSSMGPQSESSGRDSETGGDARTQAARNDAARVPAQSGGEDTAPGRSGTSAPTAGANTGTGGGTTATAAGAQGAAAGGAAAAAGAVAGGIQVLDGVNNVVQGASNTIGSGGSQQ